MSEVSETLTHPIFGSLRWLPKYRHWFTQHWLPSGARLDVVVKPHREDRHAFIERTAELFNWANDNERHLFWDAVRMKLLELYNDGWRQEGDSVLSAHAKPANSSCNVHPA